MVAFLNLRVSRELKNAVDEAAAAAGQPSNEFVARALAAHLQRPELAKIPRLPRGGRHDRGKIAVSA